MNTSYESMELAALNDALYAWRAVCDWSPKQRRAQAARHNAEESDLAAEFEITLILDEVA